MTGPEDSPGHFKHTLKKCLKKSQKLKIMNFCRRRHFIGGWRKNILYNFGMILVSFWNDVGIVLPSFCHHFGVILTSFWNDVGIILASCWHNIGIMLALFWNNFGIILYAGAHPADPSEVYPNEPAPSYCRSLSRRHQQSESPAPPPPPTPWAVWGEGAMGPVWGEGPFGVENCVFI